MAREPTSRYAWAMDSLTRTTLQFDPAVSDNAFSRTIEALHRVPGVLFTETSVGIRRALVAHDGGVTVASLVGAAKAAGATVKVVVSGNSNASSASVPQYRNGSWLSYAALLFSTLCIALFGLKIVTAAQLQWIAPIFLLVMLADALVRRRRS